MGCLRRVLPYESLGGYSSRVPRSQMNVVDNYEIIGITNAERSTGHARCMIGDLSQLWRTCPRLVLEGRAGSNATISQSWATGF